MAVAIAGKDWQAGVLGEAGIALGKVAKDKDGAARGFKVTGMNTIGTQARTQGVKHLLLRIRHAKKDTAACRAVIARMNRRSYSSSKD